jgi:two-component system phosphate regulon sensor histidine kinase PhoR
VDPVAVAAVAALGAAALLLAVGLQRRGASGTVTARTRVGADAPPATARAAEAEERAAASVRDVGVLVDLVGIGVIRVTADLTVTSANDAAARLLARRAASLPGRSVMEVSTDHRLEEIVRTALQTGAAAGELTIRTADAPTLLVRARRMPAGDAWLVLEDVTELRRLQRIRTEFIDNLAHELRTPLTTVSLLAETLALEADQLPPRTADRIAKIEVETGHLVQMVNELLDLSKIESGSAALLLSDVDLARLAGATVERLSLFAERHGVRLVVEVAGSVPLVRGDGERLGQALLNILHNAVKFSPAGGEVVVRVVADEQEVVVTVQDHGPGIPPAALTRVFERFYKGDRARTRGVGGTGLGLSIARHVVEAHGGRIWADSEEGSGSTFGFTVPLTGPDLTGPDFARPDLTGPDLTATPGA